MWQQSSQPIEHCLHRHNPAETCYTPLQPTCFQSKLMRSPNVLDLQAASPTRFLQLDPDQQPNHHDLRPHHTLAVSMAPRVESKPAATPYSTQPPMAPDIQSLGQ